MRDFSPERAIVNAFLLYSLAPSALFAAAWLAREALRRPTAREAALLCFSLAAAAVIFFALSPPRFRVLSDETDFLTTAWSIADTGGAARASEWVGQPLRPLAGPPSFRPALFPTLIAASSFVAGQRTWLGFFWNIWFLSGLLFLAARRFGAVSVIALLASPALVQAATSSGYDVAALFFLACACEGWLRFQRGGGAGLALAGAAAFAATRVEGIALLLLFTVFAARRSALLTVAVVALPLLLQRALFHNHPDVPPGESLFSFARFPANAAAWLGAFFLPGALFPFLLHYAGVGGLFWGRKHVRRWLMPACFFLLYAIFLLGFHAGQAGISSQARLFLPFSAALTLAACSLAREFSRFAQGGLACLVAAQLGWSLALPAAVDPAPAREAIVRDFVKRYDPNVLYVYARPSTIAAEHRAVLRPFTYEHDQAFAESFHADIVWIAAWPAEGRTGPRPEWLSGARLVEELSTGPLQLLRVYRKQSSGTR